MTVLPIVARELRVSARRWGTYVLRLGAAGCAIALAAIVFFTSAQSGSPASLGKTIFVLLASFAYLYALLIGVFVTSDCISSEKREGTLGLLFLTDLRGHDIVLGKLTASALDSFYALVATLPVLAIPILLGSVTPAELGLTCLSLLCTALFSVCTGMFVSTFSLRERKSSIGTFLLILFLAVGLPLLLVILQWSTGAARVADWMLALNPVASIVVALGHADQPAALTMDLYRTSIVLTLVYAIGFTLISALAVPRIWQQRVSTGRTRDRGQTDDDNARRERAARNAQLEQSPTCWLAGRGRLRGAWLWFFLAMVLACWTWAFVEVGRDMLDLGMSFAWVYFVHGVLKMFVASEAVRTYGETQKQDALELLLCTPLTVKEIVAGQQLNVLRYFRWPMLTVLGLDLLLLGLGMTQPSLAVSDLRESVWWYLLAIMFLLADCAALTAVGLWRGLIAKNSRQALFGTAIRILLLPWLAFGLTHLMLALLDKGISERASLFLFILYSLLINLFFGWQSWDSLRRNLREIAASRYGGSRPTPIWAWLGRLWGKAAFRSARH